MHEPALPFRSQVDPCCHVQKRQPPASNFSVHTLPVQPITRVLSNHLLFGATHCHTRPLHLNINMCIYTHFRYLCLHEKLKIAHPCHKAALDPHGILTCPEDTNPQVNDGIHRTYGDRTYGVGVCSSIHCAWDHSVLPVGDYGDNKRFGNDKSFEDDTEIVDTLESREGRVDRWYRLLDADQQLDHYQTQYPLPLHERSAPGNALLNFPHGAAVMAALDTLKWQELNPVCLTPAMLQWCVFSRLLPASVVDGRNSDTLSPHKPIAGPFKPTFFHTCPKKRGICKVCGENIGHPALKHDTLSYRQNVALTDLMIEDMAKEDPMGTVLDPSVDLKWDDENSQYLKVSSGDDPANGNAKIETSTTQAVHAAAALNGQAIPLDNHGADTSTAFDYEAGMDWEWEALPAGADIDACRQDGPATTNTSGPYWPNSSFQGIDDLPLASHSGFDLNDSSLGNDSTLGTDFGASKSMPTGTRDSFNLDFSDFDGMYANAQDDHVFDFSGSDNMITQSQDSPHFGFTGPENVLAGAEDTFDFDSSVLTNDVSSSAQSLTADAGTAMYTDSHGQNSMHLPIRERTEVSSSFNASVSEHDRFKSYLDPALQIQNGAGLGVNTAVGDQVANGFGVGHPVGDVVAEQPMSLPEQALRGISTDGVPPKTLRVVRQMLHQALNGGVSRLSYDPAANALYEQVLQQKVAGVIE